ncbi:cytospin-A-like [Alosa pseudoharengus]|uniref:cytospin-A-like n=1 Tax=Alosa pseudoharengus TaxID=34774 RepID=UPI003F8AF5D4
MGNFAGKDGFGPSGSHFDFFQTPPSSPSAPDLPGMSRPSLSFSAPPSPTETASGVAPATASLSQAEDALLAEEAAAAALEPSTDWGSASPRAEVGPLPLVWPEGRSPAGAASRSVIGEPPERVVTGAMAMGGGVMEGMVTEGVAMALLQLLEQHQAVLGICTGQDGVVEVLGVLKRLVVERAEFIEEVQSLKRTLESERSEWLQFQSDLQVAVAVADRLRVEAEESARELRLGQQEATERLEATRTLLRQAESDLEALRTQHAETCQRLEQEQLRAQSRQSRLDKSTQTRAATVETAEARPPSRIPAQDSGSGRTSGREKAEGGDGDGDGERDGERGGKKTREEMESRSERGRPGEGSAGEGEVRACGRGVVDYDRRTLPGFGLKDPRKIVMLSERSRSLSRLPLPSESPPGSGVGVTQTASDVVGPASQSQKPGRDVGRGRRLDLLLQRQDSWSSFYTSKPDDDQSIDVSSVSKIRPDDSFSMLLRRHGGSRRNSLLRWCQRRTQGYKNIDITNFSTSWEDGLAFCAVYHTYLPTHIPYSTLNPDNKRENLDLAFRTGESVGVAATLTAEEMLSAGGPDWQRVLEYVESMFRHFEM